MSATPGHDLSGIKYTAGLSHGADRVAVIVSKWNPDITFTLRDGALEVLEKAGVSHDNILVYEVPGSYELPAAANLLMNKHPQLDGVICLGCVIQGETRHFEFICQAVAQGIVDVSLKHDKPVIFGVLTPDTMQQAQDRAGGKYGNKGEEAAVALLEMIDIMA